MSRILASRTGSTLAMENIIWSSGAVKSTLLDSAGRPLLCRPITLRSGSEDFSDGWFILAAEREMDFSMMNGMRRQDESR